MSRRPIVRLAGCCVRHGLHAAYVTIRHRKAYYHDCVIPRPMATCCRERLFQLSFCIAADRISTVPNATQRASSTCRRHTFALFSHDDKTEGTQQLSRRGIHSFDEGDVRTGPHRHSVIVDPIPCHHAHATKFQGAAHCLLSCRPLPRYAVEIGHHCPGLRGGELRGGWEGEGAKNMPAMAEAST